MWLFDVITNAVPFWRASEDAGLNQYFDPQAAGLYLEGWANERMTK